MKHIQIFDFSINILISIIAETPFLLTSVSDPGWQKGNSQTIVILSGAYIAYPMVSQLTHNYLCNYDYSHCLIFRLISTKFSYWCFSG